MIVGDALLPGRAAGQRRAEGVAGPAALPRAARPGHGRGPDRSSFRLGVGPQPVAQLGGKAIRLLFLREMPRAVDQPPPVRRVNVAAAATRGGAGTQLSSAPCSCRVGACTGARMRWA